MAVRGLRALGIASEYDIYRYFVRGRYTDMKGALKRLIEDEKVVKVTIEGQPKLKQLYMLADDKRTLGSIISDKWEPQLNLISPFDNLITLRDRTERFFNFNYTLEQFAPKEKRKYGTYVLPILWDSDLVGRIDVKFDKHMKILNVNGVFAEPEYEKDSIIGSRLGDRVKDFAEFLGAEKTTYGRIKPEKWVNYLT